MIFCKNSGVTVKIQLLVIDVQLRGSEFLRVKNEIMNHTLRKGNFFGPLFLCLFSLLSLERGPAPHITIAEGGHTSTAARSHSGL